MTSCCNTRYYLMIFYYINWLPVVISWLDSLCLTLRLTTVSGVAFRGHKAFVTHSSSGYALPTPCPWTAKSYTRFIQKLPSNQGKLPFTDAATPAKEIGGCKGWRGLNGGNCWIFLIGGDSPVSVWWFIAGTAAFYCLILPLDKISLWAFSNGLHRCPEAGRHQASLIRRHPYWLQNGTLWSNWMPI